MTSPDDTAIRSAAFEHVGRLNQIFGTISAKTLREGFIFAGERVPLLNPQRGIFKPRSMRFLLSVRTVHPKPGGKIWYDDQREIHSRIFGADEAFGYDFMGDDPNAADNQWLRDAMVHQVPVIYFLGIAPGRYQAIIPTYIVDWDAVGLRAQISFGSEQTVGLKEPLRQRAGLAEAPSVFQHGMPSSAERRYALRNVKQRLHQARFREAVLEAYQGRCAFSGLPEPLLIDAAHIVEDRNERWGQPIVNNGVPLSKVHHAAFDAHLIGLDPDYKMHVSRKLIERHDGPMLEALKGLEGKQMLMPLRHEDAPSRERLEARFALYRAAA